MTSLLLVALREKMVKMLVELLSNQLKEKLLVVMALRLLYVLVAKYDWRVLFATEGGVRAVLGCMQEYPTSALVQQAGLAVSGILHSTKAAFNGKGSYFKICRPAFIDSAKLN